MNFQYSADLGSEVWKTTFNTGEWTGGRYQYSNLNTVAPKSLVYTECFGMTKVKLYLRFLLLIFFFRSKTQLVITWVMLPLVVEESKDATFIVDPSANNAQRQSNFNFINLINLFNN